jgi:DNA-directed RNA polymerase subunit RPC12/RpoP
MAKHIPPSRARYFENHPVVAIRLPIHLRDELQTYAQAHGTTLGMLVAKLFKEQKEPLGSFFEGYCFGYGRAAAGGKLETKCSKCGNPLTVSHEGMVEVLKELVSLLQHVKCPYCDEERKVEVSRKG